MEGEFGESGKDVGRPGPLMMYGVPPPDIRRTDGFECVLLLLFDSCCSVELISMMMFILTPISVCTCFLSYTTDYYNTIHLMHLV